MQPSSRPCDWGPFFCISACVLIALLTLFPYQILPTETELNRQGALWFWFFEKKPTAGDVFANVVLFVPFGFGCAWVIQKKLNWPSALALTAVASCAFSFLIELTQNFMPTRTSSWFDVLANAAGGPFGWVLFRKAGRGLDNLLSSFAQEFFGKLNGKILTITFFAYLMLGALASIYLGRMAMLSNWDLSYPLVLKNLPNGKSPWQGKVLKVAIADRVLAADEAERAFVGDFDPAADEGIVALYQLSKNLDVSFDTDRGPALAQKSRAFSRDGRDQVSIPAESWFESEDATKTLAARIRDANRFSIYLECSTDRPSQPGINPIVVMGESKDENDFLIGQYYSSVVLRFRTPLQESQWAVGQFRARRFFLTPGAHKVFLTYDGATVRSYVDGRPGYAPELGPGAALFSHFLKLRDYETPGYKVIYYGLMFAPLGCILGLATKVAKPAGAFTICCGLIVPAVIFELVLVGTSHRPLYSQNILLGIGLTLASYLLIGRYVPVELPPSAVLPAK